MYIYINFYFCCDLNVLCRFTVTSVLTVDVLQIFTLEFWISSQVLNYYIMLLTKSPIKSEYKRSCFRHYCGLIVLEGTQGSDNSAILPNQTWGSSTEEVMLNYMGKHRNKIGMTLWLCCAWKERLFSAYSRIWKPKLSGQVLFPRWSLKFFKRSKNLCLIFP